MLKLAAELEHRSVEVLRPSIGPASIMGGFPAPVPRKRGRSQPGELDRDGSADRPAKHIKCGHVPCDAVVKHALLTQCYSESQTLRQYVLSKLPASSRIRRRKIASVGLGVPSPEKSGAEDGLALGELLDSVIVARRHHAEDTDGHRWQQWVAFSQKGDESYVTLSDGLKGSIFSQSEVS